MAQKLENLTEELTKTYKCVFCLFVLRGLLVGTFSQFCFILCTVFSFPRLMHSILPPSSVQQERDGNQQTNTRTNTQTAVCFNSTD